MAAIIAPETPTLSTLTSEKNGIPPHIHEVIRSVYKSLKVKDDNDGSFWCKAATNGYESNFTRDGTLGGLIAGDLKVLKGQLKLTAENIGTKYDPLTGEEPGKPHHELSDNIHIDGLSTKYNACDTAALMIFAAAELARNGIEVSSFLSKIKNAADYIVSHVIDGLFVEDPRYSGAERYALKVTYWKDSVFNDPNKIEPKYPVVYTLPHIQNAKALGYAALLLNNKKFQALSNEMIQTAKTKLWAGDHFVTAIDQDGVNDPPSTDSLHALFYLHPGDISEEQARLIEDYSRQLETPFGYRAGIHQNPSDDFYHTGFVWPHEQAIIHFAAEKYSLSHAKEVSSRVINYIPAEHGIFPELIDANTGKPDGNEQQLWSIAAYLALAGRQS